MKTILTFLLALICSSAVFAQNITSPAVEQMDTYTTIISKIETDKQYTVLTFEHTAQSDDDWISLNKEIYVQTDLDNKHYNYVKSEGIKLNPDKTIIGKIGKKTTFKVYFNKIPANASSIDVIERAGRVNRISYFNYYNVSLKNSQPVVADVILAPPASDVSSPNQNTLEVFNQMSPMLTNMVRSMFDAQLSFYEQPGKIKQVAKLTKQYYDALIGEGFNSEQAIKLVTANGLLPKAGAEGK